MLNWIFRRFWRPAKTAPVPSVTSPVRVEHDDRLIIVDDGTGALATLAWADLANVTVLTTDAGPFEPDLFWVLSDKDGRQTLMVPLGAVGEHALLQVMQARLPGFDNMAVVEAMSSTTRGRFQVWPAADLM